MRYLEKFNGLIKRMKEDNADIDIKKVEEAFVLASEAHHGQYRKSGEDYIIHPVEVAEILYNLKMDTDTIVAGLLHDVVEDTLVTTGDISYVFGEDVAKLVDGVTKLRNLPKSQGKHAENIRKMVVAMSKDIRVVVIKLVDRLHNMRTLEFQTPQKQIEKSKESLEIYAPIAHRIGMSKLKAELEDISFRYLEPEEYQKIKKYLNTKKEIRDAIINSLISYLDEKLKENHLKNYTITGRSKHIYSIYKKMNDKGKAFVDLTDLLAIRIITEKEIDCYTALGIVHSTFKPIISRFKDYISVPKINGYKSIHTTVVIPEEISHQKDATLEIQIRTQSMHEIAENGVAAHWKYKEKKKVDKNESFYSDIRKNLDEKDNFAQVITEKIMNETIFVLTPKDEVREIAADATVLDFAFLIHTQIGYRTIGAKINDKIVPLDTKLKNGDKIEILTSTGTKGPGKDWLNMVNLHSSKVKIRKWFNDKEFEEKSQLGLIQLEKEFEKIGIKFKNIIEDDKLLLFMKKYNLTTIEQLAFKIQEGSISLKNLMAKFEIEKELSANELLDKNIEKTELKKKNRDIQKGIIIDGTNNTTIILAKCCKPFPGDKIRSYVSNGKGIMVHKETCLNLLNVLTKNPKREIEVNWSEDTLSKNSNNYSYEFNVLLIDKSGSLLEVVKAINELKIDIENVQASKKNNSILIKFVISIKSKEEFKRLESNLLKISSVIEILR